MTLLEGENLALYCLKSVMEQKVGLFFFPAYALD